MKTIVLIAYLREYFQNLFRTNILMIQLENRCFWNVLFGKKEMSYHSLQETWGITKPIPKSTNQSVSQSVSQSCHQRWAIFLTLTMNQKRVLKKGLPEEHNYHNILRDTVFWADILWKTLIRLSSQDEVNSDRMEKQGSPAKIFWVFSHYPFLWRVQANNLSFILFVGNSYPLTVVRHWKIKWLVFHKHKHFTILLIASTL